MRPGKPLLSRQLISTANRGPRAWGRDPHEAFTFGSTDPCVDADGVGDTVPGSACLTFIDVSTNLPRKNKTDFILEQIPHQITELAPH